MNQAHQMDKNENQYGPSPKCYDVLKNVTMDMFNSYSRDYPKRIKNRLAEKFNIPSDRILLGYGSEDILKQVIYFAIKQKGDILALPDKSWWYYKAIGEEVGAKNVEYNLIEKEDTFDYDDDQLLDILKKQKPKVLILCTPNNPTGNLITVDRIEKILQNKPKETMVILDEAYWGFTDLLYGEHMVEKYENVIVLRTFSKYYALAGLRIGFAFTSKDLSEFQIYNNRLLGYNRISEEMTFAALDSDQYYAETSKQIMADAEMLFKELKAMGFKPFKTCANFIMVKMPEKEFNFLKTEVPKKGIIIKFFTEAVFKNYVRISIGTKEQNQLLVKTMKELLKK